MNTGRRGGDEVKPDQQREKTMGGRLLVMALITRGHQLPT